MAQQQNQGRPRPAASVGLPPDRPHVIGILGGMGPGATADFYSKLVRATPATADQDHLGVVMWADPTTPDRSRALLKQGPDPTPWLVRGVSVLVGAGAEVIAMPCNTAHAFLDAIVDAAGGVPVLDMVQQACDWVLRSVPRPDRVGLLASTGTVVTGQYRHPLAATGIDVIVPDDHWQEHYVTEAIRSVKAGVDAGSFLREAALHLVVRGAQAIVAGCTEIPLVLSSGQLPVPLIDPAQILAEAVVEWAASDRVRC